MKWISGISALTSVVIVGGCGGEPGALPVSSAPAEVVVSTPAATAGFTMAPASVVATREAELATRVSGTIRRLAVDIGSRVAAGDTLVVLDTSEIDARIRSAEAAAELARQWHARIAALKSEGSATAQELDDATARLAMAEAALRDARAQREYVVLRAPFAGVITARRADPGDLALPGSPILEMIGGHGVKIEADLPGELAGRVAVGEAVSVFWPEAAARYSAHVARVVPALERSSRRFRVEARFDPAGATPDIPPGTFVRLELGTPISTTRWIPADAVVTRGQMQGVFIVDGTELRLRWVRLGQRLAETVELLAGPGADALVVRHPAPTLVDGQPIGNVTRLEWQPPFLDQRTTSRESAR
jgi:RND family efflux transporter MFP subunit